jgi:hypothetical protein
MDNKEYENVLNQYIEILMYDIHIKTYELRKNKYDIEKADIIFKNYYNEKMIEFKSNISKAKKIYLKR